MKSFSTILVILVVVGLGVAIVAAKPGDASPQSNEPVATATSTLTADITSYDFGTISMAAGKVSKTFNLTAGEAVTIERIETSCMCTTATAEVGGKTYGPFGMPGHGGPNPKFNQTLAAGATMPVVVTFDPAAHGPAGVGVIERQIMIAAQGGGMLILNFKANVIP